MTETIRLYDTAPYETTFTASVLSVTASDDAKTAQILLDRTLFFPEEGGQTSDRGMLAELPVTDVQIHAGIITHTVRLESSESVLPSPGDTVTGQIDWEHRYSNMQNHSGEHVLSGLLHNLYGYENMGFHLSDNTVTLDPSGQLDEAQLLDLERRANEVVWKNVPIICEYPVPEVLETLEYRSKKEIEGAVRIVTIEGVDACACCAPHVARTGEIGLIKILSAVRTKTGMRLTILCGKRALEEMQRRQIQAERISHMTSVPQDQIADGVEKLLAEITSLKDTIRGREQQYVDMRLQEILRSHREGLPVWVFEKDLSTLSARAMMNALCEKNYPYAGVFVGDDAGGYQYLIGSRSGDARTPNQLLREKLGARGGGKPQMVQGSVTASETAIREVLG